MKHAFNSNHPHPQKKKNFQEDIDNNKKNQLFEQWLNCNIDQKNIKTHDLHLEEYEEIPEENLHPLDYRIEIEKRFRNSVVNKIYIFPRKNENEISVSSDDSSVESIKNVELYELSSQNYKYYYKKKSDARKAENLQKEIKMGINYKHFLSLLEKTMKKVNCNDLKNFKMQNFFKKDMNEVALTPNFNTTTNKVATLKNQNKFIFSKRQKNKEKTSNKTMENSYKKDHFSSESGKKKEKIKSFNKSNEFTYKSNNFTKMKNKLSLNQRPPAISFTQISSQMNTPSISMNNKTFLI